MATKTTMDYEIEFLRDILGVEALSSDTIHDLRYKFYKGVVEGTIVLGGGGGSFPSMAPIAIGENGYALTDSVKSSLTGTAAPAGNATQAVACYPFQVGKTLTCDNASVEVTTAGAAACQDRFAIYKGNVDGYVGDLVVDLGLVLGDTTGVKTVTAAFELTPGLHWVLSNRMNSAGSVASYRTYNWLAMPYSIGTPFDTTNKIWQPTTGIDPAVTPFPATWTINSGWTAINRLPIAMALHVTNIA